MTTERVVDQAVPDVSTYLSEHGGSIRDLALLTDLDGDGLVGIGETVPEMLSCDLKAERAARPMYQEAIAYCETCKDYISRELLEDILESEEEHIDWLETQVALIEKVGLQNYTQSQM